MKVLIFSKVDWRVALSLMAVKKKVKRYFGIF